MTALNQKQQVYELLEKHENILILLPASLGGDAIGAGLGLASALKKLSKNVTIVSGGQVPSSYNFLPSVETIHEEIKGRRDFVINVNTKDHPINELRYENENDLLNIYLTPALGSLESSDISFKQGSFNYDLLIVLDCADLEELGVIYERNTELFFDVPIINIDHHSANEQFGEVNIVEITAAATSEVVYDLIKEWGKDILEEDAVTQLLAGIISATGSFQKNNTTPRTFSIAASLISKKARHQEIIRYLYKTRPLEVLQLWGRIMARLKYDPDLKIIWSVLSKEDFEITNTNPKSLAGALDELVSSVFHDTNAILIIYQDPVESTPTDAGFRGVIQWVSEDKSRKDRLAAILEGVIKNSRIHFSLEQDSLAKAEESVLEKIKETAA